jgi:hypothetical protein
MCDFYLWCPRVAAAPDGAAKRWSQGRLSVSTTCGPRSPAGAPHAVGWWRRPLAERTASSARTETSFRLLYTSVARSVYTLAIVRARYLSRVLPAATAAGGFRPHRLLGWPQASSAVSFRGPPGEVFGADRRPTYVAAVRSSRGAGPIRTIALSSYTRPAAPWWSLGLWS